MVVASSSPTSPPPAPAPAALLNAWLAIEALQPQTFANQEALLGKDAGASGPGRGRPLARALFPFDLSQGVMPWETPEGDRQALRLAEDEALTWYVPLGFVRLGPAVERLVAHLEQDGPEREEGSGVAVLALAAFDEAGHALPSRFLLSSFSWACGQVLAGRLDQLHRFVDLETDLRHALAQTLVATDIGGRRRRLHRLAPSLRGHGLVVASSNNAAVRNVSAELPLAGAVDADLAPRYFADTAREVQGGATDCWGLVAAVLGNRRNRSEFVESAWWHPDWGLEKYLAAATGRMTAEPPAIVAAEQPPATHGEALERWRQARLDYRERRATVARMLAARDQMRLAVGAGAATQQAFDDAHVADAEARMRAEAAGQTRRAAEPVLARADVALADARRLVDGGAALRPGPLAQWLGGDAAWRETQARALALFEQALADHRNAQAEMDAAQRRHVQALAQATAAQAVMTEARARLAALGEIETETAALYDGPQAGPGFWAAGHATIHTASPWADAALTQARDQLFVAALALHRAFLDAAAQPMKANLGLMMDHLKGKRPPSGAAEHLGELWDSFFLVVPVISTTFASFDRLMDGLGEGALGWLIVDEAGQATPQAAAGALWRAQRALVIGDPLQIEPISTAPQGLIRAICASHGAHPDLWAAPRASVQTLADAASPLIALMGSGGDARPIGLPLLVHRRCQEPMFSISNTIAYGGLMVHKAGGPESAIRDALAGITPGSGWIDVVSSAEKWCPEEGQAVTALLERLADQDVKEPDLYLIAPFREVADRLRAAVLRSGVLTRLGVARARQKAWGESRIGTVHTFQGKEAEAVFLVLGASADASRGSRDWAGATPNILNVAVTRAKKALYVIGRHEAWREVGVFATAAAALPVVRLDEAPALAQPSRADSSSQSNSSSSAL